MSGGEQEAAAVEHRHRHHHVEDDDVVVHVIDIGGAAADLRRADAARDSPPPADGSASSSSSVLHRRDSGTEIAEPMGDIVAAPPPPSVPSPSRRRSVPLRPAKKGRRAIDDDGEDECAACDDAAFEAHHAASALAVGAAARHLRRNSHDQRRNMLMYAEALRSTDSIVARPRESIRVYLRVQAMRCNALASVYHRMSQRWRRQYHVLNVLAVLLGAFTASMSLTEGAGPTATRYIAAGIGFAVAIVGGLNGTVTLMHRDATYEEAGDAYAVLAQRIDATLATDGDDDERKLRSLVVKHRAALRSLDQRYDAPAQLEVEREEDAIRTRVAALNRTLGDEDGADDATAASATLNARWRRPSPDAAAAVVVGGKKE